jgi:hypothetical protein
MLRMGQLLSPFRRRVQAGHITARRSRRYRPHCKLLEDRCLLSVTFLGQDAATQGSWVGTYGGQGYDVIGGPASLPSYATVTPSGQQTYTWAASTTDPRASQVPGGGRVAACWYAPTSFSVDVDLGDGQEHDLELYFLEWDADGVTEQVQLSDAATGAVLSTQSIGPFPSGVYLDYAVRGDVVITITAIGGTNALLSGLFLDPET